MSDRLLKDIQNRFLLDIFKESNRFPQELLDYIEQENGMITCTFKKPKKNKQVE